MVNRTLNELKILEHPDKTFVRRISRGFDFLGYRIASSGLVGVAQQTLDRFVERVDRLYEQGADQVRIGKYVQRWRRWVASGVGTIVRRDSGLIPISLNAAQKGLMVLAWPGGALGKDGRPGGVPPR